MHGVCATPAYPKPERHISWRPSKLVTRTSRFCGYAAQSTLLAPFRDLESALGVIDEIVAARTEERFAAPVAPVPARDDEALMRPATPARAPFAAG